MTIEEKLKALPSSPGVYLMYDDAGNVIYVGKALSLKNRVRQYFNNSAKLPKVQAMVDNVADFGYILTLSEKDAFSLEANLVKKYYPRYNILLKDDKHSPYIRLDLKQDYPAIEITRKFKKDGARYFGPYFSGIRVNDVVDIIRGAYKIRVCGKKMAKRECLNYHINLCLAPCAGRVDKQEYRAAVDKVVAFLSGKNDEAERLLTAKMEQAAEAEEFERAIQYRERLRMLELLKQRNIADSGISADTDSIAFVCDGTYGAVTVNIVRASKMMGVRNFSVADAGLAPADSLSSFVSQYYAGGDIPDEICFNVDFDFTALREYLTVVKGGAVTLTVPQKGIKKRLLDMAEKNAADFLQGSVEKVKRRQDMTVGACKRLAEILGLRSCRRLECYDISNTSGTDSVASGVVFIDGLPAKQEYRRYRIKTVVGADDFASLREVLQRRLSGDVPPPDLVVIDGGKGQLSSAYGVIREFGDIPTISLAERDELIFVPDSDRPIALAKHDNALRLLVRLRDEAHRFAVTYHRTLRGRRQVSELLGVAGVGKKKLKRLTEALTFRELSTLSAEDIAARAGIDIAAARNIARFYSEKGGFGDGTDFADLDDNSADEFVEMSENPADNAK